MWWCSRHDESRGCPKKVQLSITVRVKIYASTLTSVLENGSVPAGASSEMTQVGGEVEDYFALFDDLEFTGEDLARIDRIYEGGFYAPVLDTTLPLPEFKDEAKVTIEVEQEPQPTLEVVLPTSPPRSPMPEPPYDAFRSGKSLSVSDLIGPLWCVEWH